MTSKSPVGDISVVTLIRTDTTLDHSQKAEKVWWGVCFANLFTQACLTSDARVHSAELCMDGSRSQLAMAIHAAGASG